MHLREGVPRGIAMPFVFGLVGEGFGGFLSEEAFDDVKGHVHPRRDAGGGDEFSVIDPAGLYHPFDVRPCGRCEGPVGFVGRRGAAIEQAGGGEDRSAITD